MLVDRNSFFAEADSHARSLTLRAYWLYSMRIILIMLVRSVAMCFFAITPVSSFVLTANPAMADDHATRHSAGLGPSLVGQDGAFAAPLGRVIRNGRLGSHRSVRPLRARSIGI